MQEPIQSASGTPQYSTDTALLQVQHDILKALHGRKGCLMVLLDLLAAFDTVNHLQVLTNFEVIRIGGVALDYLFVLEGPQESRENWQHHFRV